MGVEKACALALLGVPLLLLVKRLREEYAPLLRLAIGVLLGGGALTALAALVGALAGFADTLPQGNVYLTLLLRALGLSFLTHLCAGICRDCGEGGIASGVELIGKLEILLLCLPLMREILDMVGRVLSW